MEPLDAHEPCVPAPPFDTLFGSKGGRERQFRYWDRQGGRLDTQVLTPGEIQGELDAYEGAVAYVDQEIGRLYDQLDASGALENTLLVITADHGEQFGEHRQFGHGNSLYLPLLHVPLIVSHRGRVPAGRRVRTPVSLRDVAATVVGIASPEDREHMSGVSLSPHWIGAAVPNAPSSAVLSQLSFSPKLPATSPVSKGDMQSLIADSYHYIRSGDGQEELYDWRQDLAEVKDLARTVAGARMFPPMREALAAVAGTSARDGRHPQ